MIQVVLGIIGILGLLAWAFWPEKKIDQKKEELKDIKEENKFLDFDEQVRKESKKLNKRKQKIEEL